MDNANYVKMPGKFDRLMGQLDGLPDVVKTKPSTVRVIQPLGVGGASLYVVQTVRQAEVGDTIFLETVDDTGSLRIVLPAQVADLIARQRDALTTQSRSKAGKRRAAEMKERGELPGFMRKGKRG